MAEYNNQSIDIDLEDMFNNLSDKDQEEFLVDMFRNLPGEEERADVVKDNMWYLEDDTAADIITDTFERMSSSDQKEIAERIADALTSEQHQGGIDMEKEVIVINEPNEIAKDFEEGTLLNVEGKVLRVKNDTRNESGCNVCALDAEELGEYCACAFCGDCHFIEIESHE